MCPQKFTPKEEFSWTKMFSRIDQKCPRKFNYFVHKNSDTCLNEIKLKWIIGFHGMAFEKILGAVLELPAKQHCQSSPFTWKLGAEYSSYVKSIATYAPHFSGIIIVVAIVEWVSLNLT